MDAIAGAAGKVNTPHVKLIPKDLEANIEWRADTLRKASVDKGMQRGLRQMCSEDVLFYMNGFGLTYDPRTDRKVLPFITHDFQDDAIAELSNAIVNGEDVALKKSRDMGATWITLFVIEHRWKFFDYESYLLVSRTEEYVDSPGNPKCLFWKVDFLQKHMPKWMMPPSFVPRLHRGEKHLLNPDNGSVIDGEATTGDLAAGDRRTAVMLDEFARFKAADSFAAMSATRDVTNCRLFCSTVKGTGNAFAEILEKNECRIIELPWWKHPKKNPGLYPSDGKRPAPDHKGKKRSPWYDEQCKRAVHPFEIQQELDCDLVNSNAQFFDNEIIDRVLSDDVREPFLIGELSFDKDSGDPGEFVPVLSGRVRLWIYPDPYGKMPRKLFAAGADVSGGSGASNSVLSLADKETGEKVLEFCDSNTRPEHFAPYAIAICRWFNDAFLVAEANGPGQPFIKGMIERGYRNLYYREQEDRIDRPKTMFPGWWAGREEKVTLFTEYRAGLRDGLFINRSKPAISECREIIFTSDGGIEHARERGKNDPSGARFNHGDRPTADALCWKGCKEHVIRSPEKKTPAIVPVGSLAWRRELDDNERYTADELVW